MNKVIRDMLDEINMLKMRLEEEYLLALKKKGIVKGTLVLTPDKKGMFVGLRTKWGTALEPEIMKLKKNGEPHPTATLYCFQIEDMEVFK